MTAFARIIPQDTRRGFLCKRYVFKGYKFEADKGWYRVEDALATELKNCYQDPNAADLKPIFQVATQKEAEEIARKEYEAENPTRKIQEAIAGAQSVPELKIQEVEKVLEDKPKSIVEGKGGKIASDDIPFGS